VVVQLVSTAESILNRRLNELDPEEREALELDLSPREAIVDYLTRAFPTRQMEEYVDELGDVRSRPMWDQAGNPVHNPPRPKLLESNSSSISVPCRRSRPRSMPYLYTTA